MVKRLQRKFMIITITSLFFVLLIFISTINIINITKVNRKSDGLLYLISQNDGVLPRNFKDPKPMDDFGIYGFGIRDKYSKETPFQTRYFSVKLFDNGSISVDVKNIASISFIQAKNLGQEVVKLNKHNGYEGFYRFLVSEHVGYKLIVFLDTRLDIINLFDFGVISILVGILFLVIFIVILNFLSKYAIKPFVDNMEKQKQFITNAGHEIKTPLAIISANTEVIEMFNGESEWTRSTLNQVKRMNNLVKGLLSLSKMDEDGFKINKVEVSFGKILSQLLNDFEVVANNKNLKIVREINEDVKILGKEEDIYNLISIFLDNAIKYTNENGEIHVFLNYKGNKVDFYISNTCDNNELKGNLNYLFDRFYRVDNSRARETGGYGLGLSIAESIVRVHKGKIDAVGKDGRIYFKISFNNKI